LLTTDAPASACDPTRSMSGAEVAILQENAPQWFGDVAD